MLRRQSVGAVSRPSSSSRSRSVAAHALRSHRLMRVAQNRSLRNLGGTTQSRQINSSTTTTTTTSKVPEALDLSLLRPRVQQQQQHRSLNRFFHNHTGEPPLLQHLASQVNTCGGESTAAGWSHQRAWFSSLPSPTTTRRGGGGSPPSQSQTLKLSAPQKGGLVLLGRVLTNLTSNLETVRYFHEMFIRKLLFRGDRHADDAEVKACADRYVGFAAVVSCCLLCAFIF